MHAYKYLYSYTVMLYMCGLYVYIHICIHIYVQCSNFQLFMSKHALFFTYTEWQAHNLHKTLQSPRFQIYNMDIFVQETGRRKFKAVFGILFFYFEACLRKVLACSSHPWIYTLIISFLKTGIHEGNVAWWNKGTPKISAGLSRHGSPLTTPFISAPLGAHSPFSWVLFLSR